MIDRAEQSPVVEAAEADLLDQSTPVTDLTDERTAPDELPWLTDPADAHEQLAAVTADDDEMFPHATDTTDDPDPW